MPDKHIRYARWAAVSTKSQTGEDKVSIPVQLDRTRAVADGKGWVETAGPYVVPGASRTRHINLRDAEEEIPQLRAMLDDARAGKYDILVMYDLDRLRDLLDPVSRSLADYRVQIYDINMGIEPQDPSEFDPYNETAEMAQAFGQFKSRAAIKTLRRHYRDKMPRRITDKHLHAGLGRPPFGYQKPPGRELDKNAVLIPVPSEVQTLIQIKDWFLSGWSLKRIANELNGRHIPSPRNKRWWESQIRYLLRNPFYAGTVTFGVTRWQRDRRDGSSKRTKGNPVSAEGKHSPLWDEATHRRIIAELTERGTAYGGAETRQLSRLLACPDCGAILWHQTSKTRDGYWRCSSKIRGHIYINNETALDAVTRAIIEAVSETDDLEFPQPQDKRPGIEAEISDLTARRRRWLDLYETDTISRHELAERIAPLDERIAVARQHLADIENGINNNAMIRDTAHRLAQAIEGLPDYIRNQPPAEVNADLRTLFERIVIDRENHVHLFWKA